MRKITFLLTCLMLTSLASNAAAKYVGGDISLLPKYEERGARYYNENGTRITDVLGYLKSNGMNAMRVRLFVDPSQAGAEDQGEGMCQDLAFVTALGARIKAAGFNLLLDIHYSDTWTDPGQHSTPSSWTVTSALADSVYYYTRRVLNAMIAAGAERLAVFRLEEAVYLRSRGIADVGIWVLLGALPDEAAVAARYDFTLVCYDLEQAAALSRAATHDMTVHDALEVFRKYNGMTEICINGKQWFVSAMMPGSAEYRAST